MDLVNTLFGSFVALVDSTAAFFTAFPPQTKFACWNAFFATAPAAPFRLGRGGVPVRLGRGVPGRLGCGCPGNPGCGRSPDGPSSIRFQVLWYRHSIVISLGL